LTFQKIFVNENLNILVTDSLSVCHGGEEDGVVVLGLDAV